MKTKKIIYLTPRLAVGGAEKFLTSLSASLSVDPLQQTIVSLHDDNPLSVEIDKSVGFICLPRKGKFDLSPMVKLRRLIKKEKPDIIFCLNFFAFFILRCALLFSKRPRTIISYHSTIPLNKREYQLHRIYTSLLRRKDLIVTVSANQAKYTADRYHVPAKYFKTILNGINPTKWTMAPPDWKRQEFRTQYGIPSDAVVIMMAAAFRPEKNHVGAVRALKLLHTQYGIKGYLVLAGRGVMEEGIRQLAKEIGLEEYVKFAGHQSDMRPFYWSSDLFTLCSDSVETFSIAALEAMASGLPAVLTDIGGASEMVSDKINGYLCDPTAEGIAAAWAKAIQTKYSKEKISQYIHTNFAIDEMVEEYRKLLLA